MLDPVTVSAAGMGSLDSWTKQTKQRALIEMHGLYCLSRPMRISPATAKFKPHRLTTSPSPATLSTSASVRAMPTSVSAPIAASYYTPRRRRRGGVRAWWRCDERNWGRHGRGVLCTAVRRRRPTAAGAGPCAATAAGAPPTAWQRRMASRLAGAREPGGPLRGRTGSSSPARTRTTRPSSSAGLSLLVGEETLRTFFVPFGELHYVKVPVGKR
ncbi:hypothetical protein B0H14DRAFT_3138288, partial [Mycena olivaceomarginata]